MRGRIKAWFICPLNPKNLKWSCGDILGPNKYIRKKELVMPLAALKVAAGFEEYGWDVSIFDPNVEGRYPSDQELLKLDYVLLGGISPQKESIEAVAERCSKLGVKVIGGGSYLESLGDHPMINHLLLGEAEMMIPRFIADLKSGDPKRVYKPGRDTEGNIIEHVDPSDFYIPAYHLINAHDYFYATVQFAKGCPFKCSWCWSCKRDGHKPRVLDSSKVRDVLNALYKTDFRGTVLIVDDCNPGNRPKSKRNHEITKKWQEEHDWPFQFVIQADVKVPLSVIKAAAEAGVNRVIIGFESPSERALEASGKRQNLGVDMKEVVRRWTEQGVMVSGAFIFLHTDDKTIFRKMVDFIDTLGIPDFNLSVVYAEEGTAFHAQMESEGRIIEETRGEGMNGLHTNVRPIHMSVEEMLEGAAWATAELSKPENYYRRAWKQIQILNPPHISNLKWWIAKRGLPIVGRSLKIGKTDRGPYYYGLLGRVLREKHNSLTDVVIHGIMGEQFIISGRRETGFVLSERMEKGYWQKSLRAFWNELKGKEAKALF